MKYEKPQVVEVSAALVAVQGGMKGSSTKLDALVLDTIGAYEADE
jgi:hypothetical protein